MSDKLLKVAELNSVLDQFGSSKALPESAKCIVFVPHSIEPDLTQKSKVSYKIRYKSVIANRNWLERDGDDGPFFNVIQPTEFFGDFRDFEDETPRALETHALSVPERQRLEEELPW